MEITQSLLIHNNDKYLLVRLGLSVCVCVCVCESAVALSLMASCLTD